MPSEAKSKLTIVCQWFLAKGCTDIEKNSFTHVPVGQGTSTKVWKNYKP